MQAKPNYVKRYISAIHAPYVPVQQPSLPNTVLYGYNEMKKRTVQLYYDRIRELAQQRNIPIEVLAQNQKLIDHFYKQLQQYLMECKNTNTVCDVCEKIAKLALHKQPILNEHLARIEQIIEGFVIRKLQESS